jgi:hypothetical protein
MDREDLELEECASQGTLEDSLFPGHLSHLERVQECMASGGLTCWNSPKTFLFGASLLKTPISTFDSPHRPRVRATGMGFRTWGSAFFPRLS